VNLMLVLLRTWGGYFLVLSDIIVKNSWLVQCSKPCEEKLHLSMKNDSAMSFGIISGIVEICDM